jgi:outer membrane protein TolC
VKLWLTAVCALALSSAVCADGAVLTLDAVLAQATAPHPDLDLTRARETAARAEQQLAESLDDFRVSLEGTVRSGRNATYQDRFHPDHQVRLDLRKTLYDAGRQSSGVAATREEAGARALQLLDTRAQRRLTLMARYFDALLADM